MAVPAAQLQASGQYLAALLLNTCWQSLVLVGVVAALLRLGRGANATTRYAVWGATLVAVVCLLLAEGVAGFKGGGAGVRAASAGGRALSASHRAGGHVARRGLPGQNADSRRRRKEAGPVAH